MYVILKKKTLSLLLILLSTQLFGQPPENTTIPRPKLVVGIVVDQMRWDYLYRFYERYGDDGFKRMLNEGFSCENTYIEHLPTVTAIGHSTIYTGTVPAIHGVTGNNITFNSTGETINCVEDKNVQGVGVVSPSDGQKSPVNLLTNTIGDELRLATNFRSKVFGVAIKDRGAILSAGHAANAAYWLDYPSGTWITSTYYMKDLPKWVNKFNDKNLAKKYLLSDWNTLYAIDSYIQSTEDNVEYEGVLEGQKSPTFPVKTSQLFNKNDYNVLPITPFGNTITLDFAKEIIEKEKMGGGVETDLLAISLSSTDAIGHKFGINSVEIEDTYLRLDRDLAEFFNYLDLQVGESNYTVFLTADHGASQNRNFLNEHKLPVNKGSGSIQKGLNKLLEEKFEVKDLITSIAYSQLRFDYGKIKEKNLDEQEIRNACVGYLRREPNIPFVMDLNKPGDATIPEEIKRRIINGHHPERTGGVYFILNPNTGSLKSKGSAHHTWNPDDARIPLLWMGWGIKNGRSMKQTHMTDIASTLASLLRIQVPNGNIGKTIEEVLIE